MATTETTSKVEGCIPKIIADPIDMVIVADIGLNKNDKDDKGFHLNDGINSMLNELTKLTEGKDSCTLGYGNHVGLVRRGTLKRVEAPLTEDVCKLKKDVLTACGEVKIDESIEAAKIMLDGSKAKNKVLFLYLDSMLPDGSPSLELINQMKNSGVKVYGIAYGDVGNSMKLIVSEPSSKYFAGGNPTEAGYPIKESFTKMTNLISGCEESGGGGGDTGEIIYAEGCPDPFEFKAESCKDAVRADLPPVGFSSLGRVVQLDLTIKNVCPDKKVAATIILTETDKQGVEHNRGVKHVLIPAFTGTSCKDITLRCIQFSVPEALDVSGGNIDSLCNERNFNARAIVNYVDTDFVCCDAKTVTI